ncbi:MAG TPA: hypothetical protein VJ249_03200 [Candidatus Bathyarchaeia archaeon]|nr:hypothetical protein [Candidatus Bathyarchaeia archaeon]
MTRPQSLDLLCEIPCYKCIILEPTRAPAENCNPNQCQALTDWVMSEAKKHPQQSQEKPTVIATPRTHR